MKECKQIDKKTVHGAGADNELLITFFPQIVRVDDIEVRQSVRFGDKVLMFLLPVINGS